jgi:Rrf2 family protein
MLVSIARAEQATAHPVPLYPIAVQQDISFKYLEKICRILKKSGYLRGKRGPEGGYSLTARPEEIPLGEVAMALEDEMALVDCCLYETDCSRNDTCPTRHLWQELRRTIIDKLNSYTLADLIPVSSACPAEKEAP